MSSSTEALLRGAPAEAATVAATPELRDGSWTRLGGSSVLGDLVTEQALAGLAESNLSLASLVVVPVFWWVSSHFARFTRDVS
uniref:hypothetical protein n=1 Tax=Nocardioides sp. Leaf374 TaxID=2876560 RepID=UPI001E558557